MNASFSAETMLVENVRGNPAMTPTSIGTSRDSTQANREDTQSNQINTRAKLSANAQSRTGPDMLAELKLHRYLRHRRSHLQLYPDHTLRCTLRQQRQLKSLAFRGTHYF